MPFGHVEQVASEEDKGVLLYESFAAMGMDAFAERARRELGDVGEMLHQRNDTTSPELTAQELRMARKAAAGLTNPDIGTELFRSHRTVEWHMRKVFTKLGVPSRRELRAAVGSARTFA